MRILITGGAGCLGSNLTEHFLAAGHDVLVIDNFADRSSRLVAGCPSGAARDRGFDRRSRRRSLRRFAISSRPMSFIRQPPIKTRMIGSKTPVPMSRARSTSSPRQRSLAQSASSISIPRSATAGPTPRRFPITAPMRPFTSYGISKQAGENYLALSGLPFVSFRLANVTGPRLAIGPIPDILQTA